MNNKIIYKLSIVHYVLWGIAIAASYFSFSVAIAEISRSWEREEYSYGYIVPFIVAFFIWQKKDRLESAPFGNSWLGLLLTLVGVLSYVVGSLGAVVGVQAYGFVLAVYGLVLSYVGYKGFRKIAIPVAILFFMVPLPGFIYQTLSNELQLISSELGVAVIRLFGISVFLEGNVIDLGVYKLQVVEACSGLRYLFPFTTLSFIAAYLFKVEFWKRALVFLSALPITVFMNSFRIGVIGVTVEYWGIDMAEGFLHDFEGWVVFMSCMAILIFEMFLLARIGKVKRPLSEVFGMELPEPVPEGAVTTKQSVPHSFLASIGVLILAALVVQFVPDRKDVIPDRDDFSTFPTQLGIWHGRSQTMDQIIVDSLNFDDYLMADYVDQGGTSLVNLYIGYYDVQRADKVPHSPRACLPGGGWSITSLAQVPVDGIRIGVSPLWVNRVIIERDNYRQLVYYWFSQRDRVVTSEWMVKWYLLLDSIGKSRTDGALVRLTTLVGPSEDLADGDRRLSNFASEIAPILPAYIPQ